MKLAPERIEGDNSHRAVGHLSRIVYYFIARLPKSAVTSIRVLTVH